MLLICLKERLDGNPQRAHTLVEFHGWGQASQRWWVCGFPLSFSGIGECGNIDVSVEDKLSAQRHEERQPHRKVGVLQSQSDGNMRLDEHSCIEDEDGWRLVDGKHEATCKTKTWSAAWGRRCGGFLRYHNKRERKRAVWLVFHVRGREHMACVCCSNNRLWGQTINTQGWADGNRTWHSEGRADDTNVGGEVHKDLWCKKNTTGLRDYNGV